MALWYVGYGVIDTHVNGLAPGYSVLGVIYIIDYRSHSVHARLFFVAVALMYSGLSVP